MGAIKDELTKDFRFEKMGFLTLISIKIGNLVCVLDFINMNGGCGEEREEHEEHQEHEEHEEHEYRYNNKTFSVFKFDRGELDSCLIRI